MIRLENITKCYNNKKVLDNINLIFNPNNIYIIKGVSGCGKTTLLKILCGVIKDYEGNYFINDIDVKKLTSIELRNTVGYMCQESLLISDLTIKDNLLLIENNLPKIIEYTKLFNVNNLLNKYPHQLSGGERQRIALIRTLLNNHQVLLLDEPTSSLDFENSLIFLESLQKIQNKIIILVTHKDIFDHIGTVLNINYGKINANLPKEKTQSIEIRKTNKLNLKYLLKYAKLKSKTSILSTIFICLFLVSLLSAMSLKYNYKNEYVKNIQEEYPYKYISMSTYDINLYKDINNLINSKEFIKYENYLYENANYTVYPILDYDAINFKLPEVLECGRTPNNQEEILIDYHYLENILNISKEEALNKKIRIKDKDYQIVGVVGPENLIPWQYDWNELYKYIDEGNSIFMMYDELKNIGSIKKFEIDINMYKYVGNKNIYDHNSKYYTAFIKSFDSNYKILENKISNSTSVIIYISDIIFMIGIVICIIAMVFITNQIRLNFFYRRKEFGYLQIFGLNKDQLSIILYFQYLYEIIKEIIISLIIFTIGCLVVKFITNYNMMLTFKQLLIFIILIITYVLVIVSIPIYIYLQKNINDLITK